MVTLTIDGREISVPKGTLIIRAAEQLGVYVPRFCDHPLLDPLGACRQCLVEIEGQLKPLTACTTPVGDGMVVKTQATSDIAREGQDGVLEMLLINHPLDCPMCDKGGECPLQDQALAYGPGGSRYIDPKRRFTKPVPISPLVKLDRERCVLCARCTRFASEISGDPFIELFERGALEQVAIFEDEPYQSEFSGNVIQICPVGALTSSTFRFRARPFDMTTTPSTCNRCASGCSIAVQERRGQISRVLARLDAGANDEWICDKGRFGYAYSQKPERITEPMVRKDDAFVAVSWAEALTTIAEHAGGSAAVLASGQLLDEDAYALSRFARTVLGTNDVDAFARPTSDEETDMLAALPRTATAGYGDIDRADVVVVAGTDLQQDAPIVFLRVRKNQRRRGLRVIEIGPRRSALSRSGAEWIACAPGGEAGLLLALVSALEERAQTGLDPMTRAAAGDAGANDVVASAGADLERVRALAATLTEAGDHAVLLAGEQLATVPGAQSLAWNAMVATGGRFGWVPRKAGARGAVWAGLHPDLLPAGRRVADSGDRAATSEIWGAEVPATPGRDAAAILQGARSTGTLYLFGADPVADHPDADRARRALDDAPFVVAVDMLMTESVRRAHVILPALPAYERSGTLTGWDGVARPVRAAMPPAGIAQTDLEVLQGLALALERPFPATPEAVRREMLAFARSAEPARAVGAPRPAAAARGDVLAIRVTKLLDDGAMMTGAEQLRAAARAPVIEVSPGLARSRDIGDGSVVRVASASGEVRARARVNPGLAEGVVAVPAGIDWIDARGLFGGASVVGVSIDPSGDPLVLGVEG